MTLRFQVIVRDTQGGPAKILAATNNLAMAKILATNLGLCHFWVTHRKMKLGIFDTRSKTFYESWQVNGGWWSEHGLFGQHSEWHEPIWGNKLYGSDATEDIGYQDE